MSKMDKEKMRLYQRERRKRLRGADVSAKIRMFVSPVKPKMELDEIKKLRGSSVPIDDGYKIYFLFRGDEIVYIGQTRSLLNRISAHQNGTVDTAKKEFDSIAVVSSTKESVNDDERVYIGHYAPKHNVHHKQRQYVTTIDCLGCAELRGIIDQRDLELKGLRESLSVLPAGTCKGCSDRDTANMILRLKLVAVEKELGMIKRDRKVEKQDEPRSPYRLGPGV